MLQGRECCPDLPPGLLTAEAAIAFAVRPVAADLLPAGVDAVAPALALWAPAAESDSALRLVAFPTLEDEVAGIGRSMRDRGRAISIAEAVVTVPNLADYVPVIRRVFEQYKLPVPRVLQEAAKHPTERLFREAGVNIGRFFAG